MLATGTCRIMSSSCSSTSAGSSKNEKVVADLRSMIGETCGELEALVVWLGKTRAGEGGPDRRFVISSKARCKALGCRAWLCLSE